jgi:glucose/arabinose dehydrogenase
LPGKPAKLWTGHTLPIIILLVILVVFLSACASGAQVISSQTPINLAEQTSTLVQVSPTVASPTPAGTDTAVPTQTVEQLAPTAIDTGLPAGSVSQSGEVLRLAVIGDYGLAGDPEARVASLVKSWNPDYVLTLGDNNYPDGAAATIDENIGQYYQEYIGNYLGSYGSGAETNRFYPVLGNHDWDSASGQPYLDYFTLPGNERYYDVVLGPVQIFAIDSDSREPDGVGASSTQAAWLQQQLAASTSPWKLVYFHHPPYSSAVHGSIDYMRWPFADWGATAVLSGHDHVYERLMVDGIPYFINGLGGGPRYDFTEILPESQLQYRQDYGAMLIEADSASIVFRFFNTSGVEIDRYSLGSPQASAPLTTSTPQAQVETSTPEIVSATALPFPDQFTWQPYAQGLNNPVGLAVPDDGSQRVFVVEKGGVIRIVVAGEVQPQPFLDIRDRVGSNGSEQGLLGLAFHPRYQENGQLFVDYTDRDGNTVLARFMVNPDDPNQALSDSEQRMLYVIQPYANHNGGHILFGPDGNLYVGMGDGGSGGDPQGNAQNTQTLLGKILRMDVDGGQPYAIPADNPYASGAGGLPEIYVTGVRNPWQFSFDRFGDLYVADVGQNQWEEVDYLPAGTIAGDNLGWNYREGPAAYQGEPPAGLALVDPVAWYDHSQGCSISGGVVYQGNQLPDFRGVYLYGDYCSGRVWGLLKLADGTWQNAQLFQLNGSIVGFARGPQNELFMIDQSGTIYQLVQN